ncbi:MAG: hypothetical protein JNL08_17605 [Planctomycetes bacterium]|nr:hypothetical protein [Planctomycetota bacterium]
MRILPFVLCSLLLQLPAKADKFWLSDPETQKESAEGSQPNVVVGVLIAESDEGYHVRIVGGELILPKQSVFKIEKDDLSVDAIVELEKKQAEQLAAANREREMAQAADRRAREVRALEATVRKVDAAARTEPQPAAAPAPADTVPVPRFDPVVGVTRPGDAAMSQPELLRELQLAWTLTRDRSYLKLLRQVRRMR